MVNCCCCCCCCFVLFCFFIVVVFCWFFVGFLGCWWLFFCKIYTSLLFFAMGRRIDPSWGGPIELFLVPASAPRLV